MDEFFARNRLSAYLDGELSPQEARDVELALEQSADLREELEALRGTVSLMRAGGPLRAPAGFARRLETRIAEERPPSRWRLPRVRVEAAMVAVAAAVVLVFAGVKRESEGDAVTAAEPTPTAAAPEEVAQAMNPPALDAAAGPIGDTKDAGKTQSLAEPGSDGVLGNEGPKSEVAPAARQVAQQTQQKKAPPTRKGQAVEKEAYVPEWEKADAEPQQVYAPPQVQYRLSAGEDGLRELATLASSLGGKLVDANGRPLAAYPMNPGERRVVQIVVPAYNAAAVSRKLEGLGEVQTVSGGDDRVLYSSKASVPVTVEVRAAEAAQ